MCICITFSLATVANSYAVTVEELSRHGEYHNVKISPDGKHLAALVTKDGVRSLVFLETDTYKVTYALNANSKSQAGSYYWANNERVVIQIQQLKGAFELPYDYGEIYAINYDGSKKRMIFGYRAEGSSMTSNKSNSNSGASFYYGRLIDTLENEPKYVLVQKQKFNRTSGSLARAIKLNIYNGKEKEVKTAPMSYSYFLVDSKGQPRFSTGIDKQGKTNLFYSDGKDDNWKKFDKSFSGKFSPISFADDDNSIYAFKSEDGEPKGLFRYNLKTQEETLLFQSKMADPTYAMKTDLNTVYGVRVDEDYPEYVYLDESLRDAQFHKALFQYFKGDKVSITSKTENGEKLIIHVSSDRNPGTFYLFNTKTMKNKLLFNTSPWIKAKDMAATEPFRIKTKDGLILNGFITMPKGKSEKFPTVLLPHGGPHARDYWGYDSQVQLLANAGYAVVQVNFRGSSGYGDKFEEAGYGNWGTKIQDDITLAAKYVIQQGIADKDRMCIFGTSFGGYSALQSAINNPDLYKCAIGYAGVYDLPMLYAEGDIRHLKWGDSYLDKTLGTDVTAQKLQSPVNHVDKLKAAVFIIHGEEDERAPIEHAEKLKESLEANNYPFEWLVKDKEGHGFYNEDNILEVNQKILSFLDDHIGS